MGYHHPAMSSGQIILVLLALLVIGFITWIIYLATRPSTPGVVYVEEDDELPFVAVEAGFVAGAVVAEEIELSEERSLDGYVAEEREVGGDQVEEEE